jgi:hypothetical protein
MLNPMGEDIAALFGRAECAAKLKAGPIPG